MSPSASPSVHPAAAAATAARGGIYRPPIGRRRSLGPIACLPLLLVAVLAGGVFGAVPLAAREAPPEDLWQRQTGFLLEAITVEGLERASPELIIAESLLEPGRSYTEEDLRDAVFRVRRLPFVLDAELSLRKGRRRGTYVLVIEVEETRRFFFGANLEIAISDFPLRLGLQDRGSSLDTEEEGDDVSLAAGVRFFAGRQGVAFLALRDEDGFEVGYAQHDLFGRHVFAGVTLAVDDSQTRVFSLGLDPSLSQWRLEGGTEVDLEAAVPLSARQALRLSLGYLESDGVTGSPLLISRRNVRIFSAAELRHLRLAASWAYDTRDDPVLPTGGLSASAGLVVETLETSETSFVIFLGPFGFPRVEETGPGVSSSALTAVASGTRHWPISRRQTLSSGLRASLGRSRVEHLLATGAPPDSAGFTTYELSAALRWSFDLRHPRRLRRRGDLRLELQAAYGLEATSPNLDLEGNPFEKRDLELALVSRNRWGLFRFSVSYLNAGDLR